MQTRIIRLTVFVFAVCACVMTCACSVESGDTNTSSAAVSAAVETVEETASDAAEETPRAFDYVPVIEITTEKKNINREYVTASVNLKYSIGGVEYSNENLAAAIKLRGNTSAGGAKKPYSLKFEESISLFGMDSGKKWTMLANFYEKTMMRYKLGLDFGIWTGAAFTSESEYAAVTLNGRYVGMYLIAEAVSDGKNRTGISTDDGEFIIEVCPGDAFEYTTEGGVELRVDTPSNPTPPQYRDIYEKLIAAEKAIQTGDADIYSKYIDVNSFVNLFVTMEIFKDVDGYWKSLFFTYKDGLLYAGPLWDFDLTCGNVSWDGDHPNYMTYNNREPYGDGSGDSTHGWRMVDGWFEMLLEDDAFHDRVGERFIEAAAHMREICRFGGEFDALREYISDAIALEYTKKSDGGAGWEMGVNYSGMERATSGDYDADVEYLRSWLLARCDWITGQVYKDIKAKLKIQEVLE